MKNYDDRIAELWKNKFKVLGFFSLLVVVGIVLFIVTNKQGKDELEQIWQRYEIIEKQDNLSGQVIVIGCDKGASMVSLSNGNEVIIPNSRNYDYEKFELCCFINIGDSIVKKANNDTIYIHRGDNKYYFVHRENIGTKYYKRLYRDPCK